MTIGAYRLTDGTNVVSLYPEWNFERADQKNEDVHRTRSGKQFRYLWGSYRVVKFDIEHVTSATKERVNGWWTNNTPLVLYDPASTVVVSAYLTNRDLPIGEFAEPYDNEFNGTIELESY